MKLGGVHYSMVSPQTTLIEMMRNIRRPIVANVQEGDQVLILTDYEHDPQVVTAAAAAVREVGGEPIIVSYPKRPADYYNPPPVIANAMKSANVVILLSTTATLHSPAAGEAMKAGVPIICMDGGITADMMCQGAVTADYAQVAYLRYLVGKKVFEGAKEVRLLSDFGTDLTCSLEGRVKPVKEPSGTRDPLKAYATTEEGRPRPYAVVFPGGEFYTAPVEGSANGTIVIDTSMHYLGLLSQPIKFTIRESRIIKIEGGREAEVLREYLETYGDEYSWHMPAELSVGVNPRARVTGVQREDKIILGAVHVALGTNSDIGGTITSKLHMDGVIRRPTLIVNGEVKIERGRIVAFGEEWERLQRQRQEQ